MNILFTLDVLVTGGAQTAALKIASAIAENTEHQVFFYSFIAARNHEEQEMLDKRLSSKVIDLTFENSKKLDYIVWKLNRFATVLGLNKKDTLRNKIKDWHLKRQVKYHKIDIICNQLNGGITKTLALFSDTNIKITSVEQLLSTNEKHLEELQKLDLVIANSQYCQKHLLKNIPNLPYKPPIIYNGITIHKQDYEKQARKKYNIPTDAFVFGMVSRGTISKGWAEAVEVFQQLYKEEQNIYLILVGDMNEYMQTLKQSIPEILEKHIIFTGYQENPAYWIDSFDVGLFPSYFPGETLGNVSIEYMFYDKPAIVTKYSGIPETIYSDKGNAGILIDIDKDTGKANLGQLYEAMKGYIENKDLYKKHQNLCKFAIQKFDIDNCVNKYIQNFESLLNSNKN